MRDILLEKKDGTDYYDISIENGDFKVTNGFDSSIIVSFLSDKRADQSEVAEPGRRRGWVGNELNDDQDYNIGSKLWLLEQARLNQDSVNRAITYAKDALSWMLADGLLKDIIVTGNVSTNGISIYVSFVRIDNSVFSRQYNLWENTLIA